jgi:hypothetical protein
MAQISIFEQFLIGVVIIGTLFVILTIFVSMVISGRQSKKLEQQILELRSYQAIKNDPIAKLQARAPYPSGSNIKRRIIPIGEKTIDRDGNIRQY